MVLGEFEFETVWAGSTGLTRLCSTILLIGLAISGALIMVNLIVAIIISDIRSLEAAAGRQCLLNQARHAVQVEYLLLI